MSTGIFLLVLSGILNIAVAIFHIIVIYYGAPAYRYFGAGETLASMAEKGSWIPGLLTAGIAAVFFSFAFYTFAAAGILKLPYIFIVTCGIAAIYTLRGAMIVPMLFMGERASTVDKVSSIISLIIGLIHFTGLFWNRLPYLSAV